MRVLHRIILRVLQVVVLLALPSWAAATSTPISLKSVHSSTEIRTRSTANFDVEYLPGDEGWVTEVVNRMDAARRKVAQAANDKLLFRIQVILAPNRSDFVKLVGSWAENSVAVARSDTLQIVTNGDAIRVQSAAQLEPVLVHELAHLYLGVRCVESVPRWLNEGIAMHVANEWKMSDSAAVVIARMVGSLIPLRELQSSFPVQADRQRLAYQQSYSVVEMLIDETSDGEVASLIASIRGDEGRQQLALYKTDLYRDAIELRWKRGLRNPLNWALISTSSGLFWGFAIILTFIAWYVRRRRSQVLRQEWDEEERIYEALDEEENRIWGDDDPLDADDDDFSDGESWKHK